MKKILLIKHGSLGDIISATSVIYDIKNHYKTSKIFMLTSSKYENFFEKSNLVDETIIDNRKGVFSIFIILKKIIKFDFNLIIDLQNSQRTSLYIFFIRLLTKVKINGTSFFANSRYFYSPKNIPSVINGLSNQIEILGIKTSRKPNLSWLLNKSFNTEVFQNQKFILINPGCSKKNYQKRWSAENYAKICSYILSKNIIPVVIGSNLDKEYIDIIQNIENKIVNLLNKSPLSYIYYLSKNAIGAISNDTGPAHLIAASGCKIHLILSNFSNTKTVIPQGINVSHTQKKDINEILVSEIQQKIKIIFQL